MALADMVIQTITNKLMEMAVVLILVLMALPAKMALLSSHISVKVVNV